MAQPLTNPFLVAEQAGVAALKAKRAAEDLVYLRAFFMESGIDFGDCEIASTTYLAWHQSIQKSGIRFEEHAAKLGLPNCKINRDLQDQYTNQKVNEAILAHVLAEERKTRNLLLVGGGGLGVLAIAAAWVWVRRRSLVTETENSTEARDV
jgi:hypothetical protein